MRRRSGPAGLAYARCFLYPRVDLAGGSRLQVSGRWRREAPLMANVVVVGSQWGDEGKGKIVDWLSEQADIVVRFQGGHNAGHTLVIDGTTYKLSLLPSGVVRGGKLSIIGNGVVIDPQALIEEISQLKKQGIKVTADNLRIAENAPLILPLHRELEAVREALDSPWPPDAPTAASDTGPKRIERG